MKDLYFSGLILSLLFLGLPIYLIAQAPATAFCGTRMDRSSWLQNFQRNPSGVPRTMDTMYVPIHVHLVAQADGSEVVSLSNVAEAFCLLNEDFRSARIQFFIGGVSVLPDSMLYNYAGFPLAHLLPPHNVPGRLNAYFVGDVMNYCGFRTSDGDAIVVDIKCASRDNHILAHEVAHYLSIPHTFLGWEDISEPNYDQPAPQTVTYRGQSIPVEKVDGSNCDEAGDGFCDTPPDYLNIFWPCLADSTSEQLQLDPDSVAFRSRGNIMSYSNWVCCERNFSREQGAAMRAYLEGPEADLIVNPTLETLSDPNLSQLNLVTPAQGASTPYFDSVQLAWTPVEAAAAYEVQLNILNDFSQGVALKFFIVDTTLLIQEGLSMNRRYYWRVRPIMPYKTCEVNFSTIHNFRTGTTSPVTDPVLSGALKVYPNPVTNGTLVMELNDSNRHGDLDFELIDRLGRTVRRGKIGDFDTTRIDISGLPQGIYFLRARADGRFTTKKIIVN